MSRYIDANKLQMRIADLQLMTAPDERDSEDVQQACRRAVADLEELSKLVEEQPTVNIGNKWHSVHKELPNPNAAGEYLCLQGIDNRYNYKLFRFTSNLKAIDKHKFYTNEAGFYCYDSTWGFVKALDVEYWMELPKLPED